MQEELAIAFCTRQNTGCGARTSEAGLDHDGGDAIHRLLPQALVPHHAALAHLSTAHLELRLHQDQRLCAWFK